MPKRKKDRDGLYQRGDSPFWWASLIDTSGKRTRRSTGTADRREAEQILARWRLDTRREVVWGEQPSRTFDELMLNYLRETQPEKRSAERDRYSAKALYTFWTGRTLNDIGPSDVRGYIEHRRCAGVSDGTIARELGMFSSALNHARREWDWDVPNPVSGRKPREPEGRVRWITREEAERLVRVAEANPRAPHLADFIRLALHTGCRRGELLGLEWKRVDLQAGLIHLEAKHTKAGRRRSVPINSVARSALVNRLRWRAGHAPDTRWVFCDKEGEGIQSVKKSFAAAVKKAGISDFRIHDMRHTCAAWLVSAGVPLTEVRDLLGHRSVTMTERYAHLAPHRVQEAVERLAVL
jgi:integrase